MECSGKLGNSQTSKATQEKGTSGSRSTGAQSSHHTQVSSKKNLKQNSVKCFVCAGEHYTNQCDRFKALSTAERKSLVSSSGRCFNCLGAHFIKECKSNKSCLHCKQRHHSLLHEDRVSNTEANTAPPQQTVVNSNQNQANSRQMTQNISTNAHLAAVPRLFANGVLLATAKVYVQAPNGFRLVARALIDNCSQPSFISASLCQRLHLKQSKIHAPINAVGEQTVVVSTGMVQVSVHPWFESSYSCEVQALVLPRVSSYVPPKIGNLTSLVHLEGLEFADPHFMENSHIDLLLGAPIYSRIIQSRVIKGEPNMPIAMESHFGWLLLGELPGTYHSLETATAAFHCAAESQLNETLQKFWRREEVPKVSSYTRDDQSCEEHFVATHKRDDSGRYIVKLPFKISVDLKSMNLSDSYTPALKMLHRMESKFNKDQELKIAYGTFLKEYEQLGHMVSVHPVVRDEDLKDCFFLPHHGVWKESSTTTKLRTVFNGSTRIRSGNTLNDMLHSGPNLLPNLLDLICKWRNYEYVFAADVEKMYRQISVDPSDQQFQSILWRFDQEKPVEIYRLTTVTYGLTSSSFLALRVIKQLSVDHRDTHPLGSEVINSETYMDDVLSGAHSIEEAFQKQRQTLDILKEGGFPLRKWLANDTRLLEWLPPQLLASEPGKSLSEEKSAASILGLHWDPKEDSFTVQVDCSPIAGTVNKRSILSKIARIFDPMGWLTPVVITAKILMQSLWLLKVDWDSPLPEDIVENWTFWNSQLDQLLTLKIPRWSHYSPRAMVELHGFADASKRAYGSVIYLRVVTEGEIFVTLQLAKSRVAPIKTLTIPKLELCAAHLLAKLAHHYLQVVRHEIHKVYLWSDAKDVLYWLKGHPSRWPTFIAHRSADIHTLVPNASWHYVNTRSNPADIASRGIEPRQCRELSLWWEGPQWLRDPSNLWPVFEQEDQPPELGQTLSVNAAVFVPKKNLSETAIWSLIEAGFPLNKLLRITALCIRFIYKMVEKVRSRNQLRCQMIERTMVELTRESHTQDFRSRQGHFLSPVSKLISNYLSLKVKFLDSGFMKFPNVPHSPKVGVQELDNARLLWVYLYQRHYYPKEMKALSRGKALEPRSTIKDLAPFVQDGLLKVGGRLSHSCLESEAKHPLILPGDCLLSNLLINKIHSRTCHGGIQLTLSTIRRQYWLTKGRSAVKAVVTKCVICRRHAARTPQQIMGDLPASRVNPAHPFEHSGVDFAGPYSVRLSKHPGKGTFKGYVSVFICLSTRAIHLELVEDYSAEAFIACFERFVSRRGHCSELTSDQGTNFIGADSELQQMYREASEYMKQVMFSLAQDGTTWNFNPPGAPHMGGIWEAAVKSAKHHISRVIGVQVFTFVELSTLLCRVEACLNSRPLMPLHDSPTDLDYLTPAHFLIQRSSYFVPRGDVSQTKVPYGKRWERLTQAVQHFWQAWKDDYLTSLQRRNKWLKIERNFKVGDVVIVHRELTPPGKWPLARVVAVHPGPDGRVRVATLRSATSTFQRPITKLVLLLGEEEQQESNLLPAVASQGALPDSNSSIDEGRWDVRNSPPNQGDLLDQSRVALPERRSARVGSRARVVMTSQ